MKIFIGAFLIFLAFHTAFSQTSTNTYPGGARNWSALTWIGGTPPTTNNTTYTENLVIGTIGNGDNLTIDISFTLIGNTTINSSGSNPTITIPVGVTVVINGNLTDFDNNIAFVVNGTLIVTGTFKGKNNAVFSGSGTIAGGTLDLGNGASCSGGCPTITFTTCTQGDAFCTANVGLGTSYVWNGSSSSNWQTAANWSPTRTTPGVNDFLTFSGSSANKSITNIPTQTVGNKLITGSSTYSFAPASAGNTLTLSKATGNAIQIDNGSTLSVGASNTLNLTMPSGGTAEIGGQLNLLLGTFNISSATLILYTNSAPLARTSGQVSANSSTTLKFGDTGVTAGTITLPSSIFNGTPTISTLVMNTASATLGDQTITVGTSSTFTFGVLNTNAAGRIKFLSSSIPAVESNTSYISGYAEMGSTAVGTGALSYLGMTIASGANDIGSVTLLRRTGSSGINTFNSKNSIASSWDVTSNSNPAVGRNVSFTWRSAFDNGSTSSLKFQTYINTGSGFNPIGTLQVLSAVGPPRQSAPASTTLLNNATFTVSDENNVLPIELISFSAKAKANSIDLFWKTASEKNNDYFLLERMIADYSFKTIAQIKGAGSTLLESSYSATDENPYRGANYYRLKQVDFDGQFSYSNVVREDFYGKSNTEIIIYPNPSEGILNFDNLEEDTFVSLSDSRGKIIITAIVKAASPSLEINEQHLPSGLYIVRIQSSKGSQAKKLIIN